jgi:hypothetical protein
MKRLITRETNWELFRAVISDPRPQYVIAEAVGRYDAWLSRVIHGRASASKDDQKKIAEVLGFPVHELFLINESVAA